MKTTTTTTTIKTFDKKGKITKQAQKARFPQYIAYIDLNYEGRKEYPDYENGLINLALVNNNLIDAMQELENGIKNKLQYIYLYGIYTKTQEYDDIGLPLYKMEIGARVQHDYNSEEYNFGGWHIWDKAHGETEHGLYIWLSEDYARDELEKWSKKGKLYYSNN